MFIAKIVTNVLRRHDDHSKCFLFFKHNVNNTAKMCSLKHTNITHNHFYVLKAQKIYYELYYINQTTEIRHSPAPRNSPSDGNQKDVQCCHIEKIEKR